jgi:hypothetical protein
VRAIAFVPSAPFLLLGAGPAELRAAIAQALSVLSGEIVVVGAAPTTGLVEGSVDLTPYGGSGVPSSDPLPLALAVGRTLLGDRPHRLFGVSSEAALPEADSLLVVADGSAKRSEKAPGYFDPRAADFDAALSKALRDGSPEQLQALDPTLAADLWATGLPALRTAASVGSPQESEVLYDDAPFGVGYVVATWRF